MSPPMPGLFGARPGGRRQLAENVDPPLHDDSQPGLWALSQAHWDLCIELDEEERVCRIGGRRAHCLAQPRHVEVAYLGDYIERRSGRRAPPAALHQAGRLDLALRSANAQPLVFRLQVNPRAEGGYLLLGTDISDLNWQTDRERSQLHCFNVGKLLASRLRQAARDDLPEAVGEVLEVFAGSFLLQSIALVLAEPGGRARVFASFVRGGSSSLLRDGLELPFGELGALASCTLLSAGEQDSALLDRLCCERLQVVPAPMPNGQSAWLLGEPEQDGDSGGNLSPHEWSYLAEQLAAQVLNRLNGNRVRDGIHRLRRVEDLLQAGWWRYDPQIECFEFSPAAMALLALADGQARLTLEALLQRLQPADADELLLRLRRLELDGELLQDLRLDAQRWVRLQGRLQACPEGVCLDGVVVDISAAKQHEQQAVAMQARLRSLVDKAPVGLYVQRVEDGQLVPEFCSEAATDLLGPELPANDWQALAERVHPEDLHSFCERGRELLREGRASAEYRLRDAAGQWRWLYDEARLLYDDQGLPCEAVGLWLDVGERHAAARLNAASEARYRALVEESPALICRYSSDLQLTFVNRTFAAFLGEPAQALLGRRLDCWLSARDCSALRARLADAARGGTESPWELRFRRPGQDPQWLLWHDRLLFDEQGQLQEVQAVARDDTPLRQARQQLARGARMVSLGQRVGGIAHELKQPLHVMRMALFNAWQRLDDRAYLGEKLQRVDAQVDRLARTVEQLGIFSRNSDRDLAPFDPYASCEAVAELLGESLARQGITLELPATAQRFEVLGHADQLEEVLLHLLINARDALLDRAGADDRRIRLEQRWHGGTDWLELQVSDNAGGIAPALRERIFEPFFSTKPAGQGSGLGLTVSHDLVRNMGGSLSVGEVEGGAVFVIRLPLAGEWQPSAGSVANDAVQ